MTDTLPLAKVKAVYDELGRWQDTQAFYEQPAKEALIAHAEFEAATSVLEIGGGTGRFAEQLLDGPLPPEARYHGLELSTTMVALSRERLARFGERATVEPTSGRPPFDVAANAMDRVVVNYVFDLLSPEDTRALLDEAQRVLRPGGRLCVASLTEGRGPVTRLVSRAWTKLFQVAPLAVGGCRPVELAGPLRERGWTLAHRAPVPAWGLTSEVVVAAPP